MLSIALFCHNMCWWTSNAVEMPSIVKGCPETVKSILEDGQCSFYPGRSTTDLIFTLKQIFEKSWKYANDVFACFVDLEKPMIEFIKISSGECYRSMTLMGVCWWPLNHSTVPEVSVRLNGKQFNLFHVGVGLQQGCSILSPLLFIIYTSWMDKRSRSGECITIETLRAVSCFSQMI